MQGKVTELEELAKEIEHGATELFEKASVYQKKNTYDIYRYYWNIPSGDLKDLQRDVLRKYQLWFSSSLQLIMEFLPEKSSEFDAQYKDLFNGLMLDSEELTSIKVEIINTYLQPFEIQRSILLSVPYVVDIKELSLRKVIASDFISSELREADRLFKEGTEGTIRAAGVLAGVALEKHLKTLCDSNGVKYNHDATIAPLAQTLHDAGKIDTSEQGLFEYLGKIRNDCAHPNEILPSKVKELIERVKKIVI